MIVLHHRSSVSKRNRHLRLVLAINEPVLVLNSCLMILRGLCLLVVHMLDLLITIVCKLYLLYVLVSYLVRGLSLAI